MGARQAVAGLLLLLLGSAWAAPAEDGAGRVSAGDYVVRMTAAGIVVTHKGTPISIGSYLSVYGPGYKGSVVSSREGWRTGRVSVDGHTVRLEARLPKGSLTYSATVSIRGVRVEARVTLAEGVAVGPVRAKEIIVSPQVGAEPGRHGLLADIEMQR